MISALVCLAPGSEEIEVVTTIDLMVRGGIDVTVTSVADNEELIITCSRGVKLVADIPLSQIIDYNHDIIILPGGIDGAKCFHDNQLLISIIRKFYLSGRIVAAICAVTGMVLVPHNLFPTGKMTGFPKLKNLIPKTQWQDDRVVWDPHVNLLTSQGPGTAIDFALKIIDLLIGNKKAYEVASSLIITSETYNCISKK